MCSMHGHGAYVRTAIWSAILDKVINVCLLCVPFAVHAAGDDATAAATAATPVAIAMCLCVCVCVLCVLHASCSSGIRDKNHLLLL